MSNAREAKIDNLFKKVNRQPHTAQFGTPSNLGFKSTPIKREKPINKYISNNITAKFRKDEKKPGAINQSNPFDVTQNLTKITITTEHLKCTFQEYEHILRHTDNAYLLSSKTNGNSLVFQNLDESKTYGILQDLSLIQNIFFKMVTITGHYLASQISQLFVIFKNTEHFNLTEIVIVDLPFMLNQLINILPIDLYGITIDATKLKRSNFHDDLRQLCTITYDNRRVKHLVLFTTDICDPTTFKLLIKECIICFEPVNTVTVVTNAYTYNEISISLMAIKFRFTKTLTSSKYGTPETFNVFSKTTTFKSGKSSTLNLAFRSISSIN